MDVWLQYKTVVPLAIAIMFSILGGVEFGFVFGFIIMVAMVVIDHCYATPEECKVIKEAKQRSKPVIVTELDNHVAVFSYAIKVHNSGFIETKKGWIGCIARPSYDELPDVDVNAELSPEQKKKHVKKRDLCAKIRELTTRVAFLPSAKVPILFGTVGKVPLTNMSSVSTLTYSGIDGNFTVNFGKDKATTNKKDLTAQVLFPVSFTDMKAYFNQSWDENQVESQLKWAENAGIAKGKELMGGKPDKLARYLGLILIGVGLALIILGLFT